MSRPVHRRILAAAVVLLVSGPAYAAAFHPSRAMRRVARLAIELEEQQSVDHAFELVREARDHVCPNEPKENSCGDYLTFVEAYILQRQSLRAIPVSIEQLQRAGAMYKDIVSRVGDPRVWANLAIVDITLSNPQSALRALQTAEQMQPGVCTGTCALAYADALSSLGRAGEAVAWLDRASAASESHVAASERILDALTRQCFAGHPGNDAPRLLRYASELAAEDPDAAVRAADCILTNANADEALASETAILWLRIVTRIGTQREEDEVENRSHLPSLAEVRDLRRDPVRAPIGWWMVSPLRRNAVAAFLLSLAEGRDIDTAIPVVTRALAIAPRLPEAESPPGLPLRAMAALELESLYARDLRYSNSLTALADEMLAEMTSCDACVERIAVLAGTAALDRGQARRAIGFLKTAANAAEAHPAKPRPDIDWFLARAYDRTGDRDAAIQHFVASAMSYLQLDDPRSAFQRVAEARQLAFTEEVQLLADIAAARIAAPRESAQAFDPKSTTSLLRSDQHNWLFRSVSTKLPADFVNAQQEKTRNALLARAEQLGRGADARKLFASQYEFVLITWNGTPSGGVAGPADAGSSGSVDTGRSFLTYTKASSVSGIAAGTPMVEVDGGYRYFPHVGADRTANSTRGGSEAAVSLSTPILPDRIWIFGAYAPEGIRRNVIGGTFNDRDARTFAGKITAQITPSLNLVVAGQRQRRGERNLWAAPARALDARIDDEAVDRNGRIQSSWVVTAETLLKVTNRRTQLEQELEPVTRDLPLIDAHGFVTRGGVANRFESRTNTTEIEAVQFGRIFGDSFTLRFTPSFSERHDAIDRDAPGDAVVIAAANVDDDRSLMNLWRSGIAESRRRFVVFSASGNISLNWNTDLAATVGRIKTDGRAMRTALDSNPLLPQSFPAVVLPGTTSIRWAANEYQIALAHGSRWLWTIVAARTPSSMSSAVASFLQLTPAAIARFGFVDLDGNGRPDGGDYSTLHSLVGVGVDPLAPMTSPNAVAADLHPELTDRVELRTSGAHWSARLLVQRDHDVLEARRLIRDDSGAIRPVLATDYRFFGTIERQDLDGGTVTAPLYFLDPACRFTGGSLLVNGDRERRMQEAEGTLRGGVSLPNDRFVGVVSSLMLRRTRWSIGNDYRRHDDPTPGIQQRGPGGTIDADAALPVANTFYSGDERAPVYASARWFLATTARYETNLSTTRRISFDGTLTMRDGNIEPQFATVLSPDGRLIGVRLSDHQKRYPIARFVNAAATGNQTIGQGKITVQLSVSNVLNAHVPLLRIDDLTSPRRGEVQSTQLSRTFALNASFSWSGKL